MHRYSFETSQPLNAEQIAHINAMLLDLPSNCDDASDVPEWITELTMESQNTDFVKP